ncbi:hypothetical protein AB0B50_28980 [Streptomyces sp. NPDC041068]|uniref:hypothetical protein n=1 Tax=Streptomyces sp. NPDC041068 TaxID=3155130 RepID=UPI00340057EC
MLHAESGGEPFAYWILLIHVDELSGRPEAVQTKLRETLDGYVRWALADARVRVKDCRLRDRDTGLAVLVPSSAPSAPRLLRDFVRSLDDCLSGHDEAFNRSHHLSVRVGMHHGLVAVRRGHWSSRAIHELTTLVEATPEQPPRGGSGLVLVLSNTVHQSVVLSGYPGIRAHDYAPITIAATTDDRSLVGWVTVPRRAGPPRWAPRVVAAQDESSPRTDPGGHRAEPEGQPVPGISGPLIHPDFRLGDGGQGTVYAVVREVPGLHGPLAYKDYKPGVLQDAGVLDEMVRFLWDLERHSPADHALLESRLAWPLRLSHRNGQPCGFVMRRIPPEYTLNIPHLGVITSLHLEFLLNPDVNLNRLGLSVNDEQRLRLLKDLANTLRILHHNGIIVGDLSPRNILFRLDVWPRCLFLDCDSMRFRGQDVLPQAVTEGWDVPEREKATPNSDRYKFGLVALRLFNRDQNSTDSAALGQQSAELEVLAQRSVTAEPGERPELAEWMVPLERALAGGKPDLSWISVDVV